MLRPTLIASVSLAVILIGEVLPATRHIETDFANYYIPARLIARHESTARLYEFSWFQRQMEYAGIHDALGGFNYFPPPAALPLVPLGRLEPIPAKAVWTVANFAMLLALVVTLQQLAGLPLWAGLGLAAISWSSLHDNFLFGQFYIALTVLIAAALLLLIRGRSAGAGVLLGVGTALKLYPAPFLVYFLVRRDWRAVGAFLGTIVATYAISIAALGWPLHEHYFASILPAALAGQTDTPYHPALQSWTNVLRLLLVQEPTLNPHPLVASPFLFTLLRDASLLSLLALLVYTIRDRRDAPAVSLMVLALLLLSTSAFSYHALLAIIPVACWLPHLWRERRWAQAALVLGLYLFATSPFAGEHPMLHLRLIALAALFYVLFRELRPWRLPLAATTGILIVSTLHAVWSSRPGPADDAQPVAWDAFHLESPAVGANDALVYSALGCAGCTHYQLRGRVPAGLPPHGHQLAPSFADSGRQLLLEVADDGESRVVGISGRATLMWSPRDRRCQQPAAGESARRVVAVCNGRVYYFDAPGSGRPITTDSAEVADPDLSPDGTRVAFARLVAGHWRLYQTDLERGTLGPLTSGAGDERGPRYSPDGRRLVFSRRVAGWDALWLWDFATGTERRVSRSTGNDNQPAWARDGRSLYFASDRGRGIFMPAIYRLELP